MATWPGSAFSPTADGPTGRTLNCAGAGLHPLDGSPVWYQWGVGQAGGARGGPYGGIRGCGTVRPFRWLGLLELPATMPQDVFVRHAYGMSVREIDDLWSAKFDHIRAVGGVAVVSVHPRWISMSDPELRAAYRRLLERIASEDDLLASTPSGLEAALVASGPSP